MSDDLGRGVIGRPAERWHALDTLASDTTTEHAKSAQGELSPFTGAPTFFFPGRHLRDEKQTRTRPLLMIFYTGNHRRMSSSTLSYADAPSSSRSGCKRQAGNRARPSGEGTSPTCRTARVAMCGNLRRSRFSLPRTRQRWERAWIRSRR